MKVLTVLFIITSVLIPVSMILTLGLQSFILVNVLVVSGICWLIEMILVVIISCWNR